VRNVAIMDYTAALMLIVPHGNRAKQQPMPNRSLVMAIGLMASSILSGAGHAQSGLVIQSSNFGNPCTQDAGDIPRIYDNATKHDVDVSIMVVNTGATNLFITDTGFVIPPIGPQSRPRIMRVTLAAGQNVGIRGQGPNCSWTATVWPHEH
jgi:hypothetical protein